MKKIVKILCFFSILFFVLFSINKVLKFKYVDGIYCLDKFYELEDNTVDVLVLGSSHAFQNINTGVLWDDYGISSYIMAGSIQPYWNSYHFLVEALKTQKPKVILFEAYSAIWPVEYIDESRIIKNNFGLKFSKNKIDSLNASAPKEDFLKYFLEYTQYHSRYGELDDTDFIKNQNNEMFESWNGFCCNMKTESVSFNDVSYVKDSEPLFYKNELYLRKIIELSQKENIPLVIFVAPFSVIGDKDERIFNSVSEIAAEYGIQYVDYNLIPDKIGLDYSVDMAEQSHLNYKGNQKFTRYIGETILNNYSLPDHRGDSSYYKWQKFADYTRRMINNQEIVDSEDVNEIAGKILDDNYILIMSNDNSDIGLFDGIIVLQNNNVIWQSGAGTNQIYLQVNNDDFVLTRNYNSKNLIENTININGNIYKTVENGINYVIYDSYTKTVVDNFALEGETANFIRDNE